MNACSMTGLLHRFAREPGWIGIVERLPGSETLRFLRFVAKKRAPQLRPTIAIR
ncbi:MAG: hypothetical protein GXP31_06000 [Kiritimatiellaeota bacterium]|nr:hypothetical protein [Kiritimatiellota bacterium]